MAGKYRFAQNIKGQIRDTLLLKALYTSKWDEAEAIVLYEQYFKRFWDEFGKYDSLGELYSPTPLAIPDGYSYLTIEVTTSIKYILIVNSFKVITAINAHNTLPVGFRK